ncbi:S-layer homology domain-containing protein [Clostridia bacterium]|nr:S-layer homology domain-containing protein [Clostridia bacterium]
MKQKALSVILTLCMVLSFFPLLESTAVASDGEWSYPTVDNAPTGFTDGIGTQDNPYIISSAQDLADLAYLVNQGEDFEDQHFKLAGEIDLNIGVSFALDADTGLVVVAKEGKTTYWLGTGIAGDDSGSNETFDSTKSTAGLVYTDQFGTTGLAPFTINEWVPIGAESSKNFSGIFDGNGNVIKGIYIDGTTRYQGLFGHISNGTVENLGIVNSYITASDKFVAGIAAFIEDSTLSYCYNEGIITGTNNYVAGVVGYSANSMVSYCYNTGTISGNSDLGGVAGRHQGMELSHCYNTGNISGDSYIGGVVGYGIDSSMSYSHNTGTLSGTDHLGGVVGYNYNNTISYCYNTGKVSGANHIGGFSSLIYTGKLSYCYNTGSVSGDTDYIGGMASQISSAELLHCYNTGTVSGTSNVGGLIGNSFTSGAVLYCYNSGFVSGYRYLGGLVGFGSPKELSYCYNSGTIACSYRYVGAILGQNSSNYALDCYYDKQMSTYKGIGDKDYSNQAEGISTLNMIGTGLRTGSSGEGWTDEHWTFSDNIYPRLADPADADFDMDTTDAAYVSAAPLLFSYTSDSEYETANTLFSTIKTGSYEGVTWYDDNGAKITDSSTISITMDGISITAEKNSAAKEAFLKTTEEDGVSVSAMVLPIRSEAELVSVLSMTDTKTSGAGSSDDPVLWNIDIDYSIFDISVSDITASKYSKINLYLESDFSDEIMPGNSLLLTEGGTTDVYITVTANDDSRTVFYSVAINKAARTAPEVSTLEVSQVMVTEATLGGNVSDSGGEPVSDKGVLYSSTDDAPVMGAEGVTKVSMGTGTGSFGEVVSGLSPSTTYYIRSYATNNIGTSYGSIVAFTTDSISASLSSATSLTEENLGTAILTIKLSGTTFVDGELLPSSFTLDNAPDGVTIEAITYANNTECTVMLEYDGRDFDSDLAAFSVTIGSIELASENEIKTSTLTIGARVETVPTLTTSEVSQVTATEATLGGNVSDSGGEPVSDKGVLYSSTDDAPVMGAEGVTKVSMGTGTGSFGEVVSGLSPSTTYYIRSYATNNIGTSYGSIVAFTTDSISASLSSATSLTEENLGTAILTIKLSGTTFVDGELLPSSFTLDNAPDGVTIEAITYDNNTECTVMLGYDGRDFDSDLAAFSVTIGSIELASENEIKTSTLTIGARVETVPTLTTSEVSQVTATEATLGGNVSDSGGEPVSDKGVLYSSTDDVPVMGAEGVTKVSMGTGTGSFSEVASGLSPSTTYYLRSYAVNSLGRSYGEVESFTTSETYTVEDLNDLMMSTLKSNYSSGTQETKIITILCNGTGNLTGLAVSMSGADAESFSFTQPKQTNLVSNQSTSFTIAANNGLAKGVYEATVMVSADNMDTVVFIVTQNINNSRSDSTSSSSNLYDDVVILVNGKGYTAAKKQNGMNEEGRTKTKVSIDTDKLKALLNSEADGLTVEVPIISGSDIKSGLITGKMVKNLEEKNASLMIKTSSAIYTLPAKEIDIDAMAARFGEAIDLSDITVEVMISEPNEDMELVVEAALKKGGLILMVEPIEFTVSCTYNGETRTVSSYKSYVERRIEIPSDVDAKAITTAVIVDSDGSVRHVPTQITVIEGIYYAVINSLTNSVYALIYNPIEFEDVEGHWAQNAVNDMASRKVISGYTDGTFNPNGAITRAEFAVIMVQALGLDDGAVENEFSDVADSAWYSGYIATAKHYGLISGYEDGTFRPNDRITREQAITILALAMDITELDIDLTESEISTLLGTFKDDDTVSAYAETGIANCLKAGIVSGKDDKSLAPKDYVTRAEVAAMAQRLLQKSGLI